MSLRTALMVKAAAHMMSSKEQVENFMRGTKPAEVQHVEVLKKLAGWDTYENILVDKHRELKPGPWYANLDNQQEKTEFFKNLRQSRPNSDLVDKEIIRGGNRLDALYSMDPAMSKYYPSPGDDQVYLRRRGINNVLTKAKTDSNLLDPSKVKNEGGPTMAFRVRQILDSLKGNRGAQAGIGAGLGGLAGAGLSAALGGGRGANTLAALLGAGALGTAGYMYGDKAHQYLSDAAKKYIGA